MRKPGPLLLDSLFLIGIVLISTLPVVTGLGFYSDGWSYQAVLAQSAPGGISAMFQALASGDPSLLIRPVQLIYLVSGFKLFGLHATPYHLLNSAILGLVTALLYLVLERIRIGRAWSLAIALVFGFLPQYSTDRFWIASEQATLCMAFALLAICALLRLADPEERNRKRWIAFASVSMVLSILSYEVALGLIVAALAGIAWQVTHGFRQWSRAKLAGILIAAVPLLVFGVAKGFLQQRYAMPHHFPRFLAHMGELGRIALVQVLRFSLWTYLLHLPSVLMSLFARPGLSRISIAMALTAGVLTTAYLWRYLEAEAIPDWRACLRLAAAGLVFFELGYAWFFLDPGSSFETAGLNNRVAIASAVGASCILVALLSLICSCIRSTVASTRFFTISIGLVVCLYCLVLNGIGSFWVNAASSQAAVINSVTAHVRSMPRGSVLLLDGFCRYLGPAVVFETDWDASGAIQLAFEDPTLTSDVIAANTKFTTAAVDTSIYGAPEGHYPYGNRLFVYNVSEQMLVNLRSRALALAYMQTANHGCCPAGREGEGVRIY